MGRKIAVGMVINNLEVGGLEKVVVSLLNHLPRDVFDLHLICLMGAGTLMGDVDLPPERRLILEKSYRRKLPIVGLGVDPSLFTRIRRFVRERRLDILHAHNLAPLVYAGIATRVLPMRRRPVLVYSEHNQIYSASEGQRRRFRLYLKLADQVVAVSRDLERTLVEKAQARPDKLRVLYNGIDGDRFAMKDDSRGRVRRELGIGDDEFVVGTAVVLSEQKGITYLLDAARQALARAPAIRFVIAGDGPKRQELLDQARALGLDGRVSFLGYRRDVPDLISSYDVYALPSLWEGLPLALLEALAIGKPILCTSVGGNPEIVEDGVNGYVVPPRDSAALADRILRLHAERDQAPRTRERNVQKFNERFSLSSMVEAHARLFQELAAGRG